MKERKNIVELFPCLFELDSEDRKWYESLGMTEDVNIQFDGLDIVAKEFALEHILHSEKHADAVKECVRRFQDGACWYKTNIGNLDSLIANEYRKAIDIAINLYSERECRCIEPEDNDYNENNVKDQIEVTQDCFESGIEWACKEIFLI